MGRGIDVGMCSDEGISDERSLAAFFGHLGVGGTHEGVNVSAFSFYR